MDSNSIKICSANCQGLGNRGISKRRDVLKYMKTKKFDIYFLQDTHLEKNMESIVRSEWGYECWFSSFNSRSRGVAILFNNTFEFNLLKTVSDPDGNYIIMHVTVNSSNYVLVNVYAPNRNEPDFFRNINQLVQDFDCNNIIIGGDWNLLIDNNIDGKNYLHINNPRSKEEVKEIILNNNLIDIWRSLHPLGKQYTWHKKVNGQITQQEDLIFSLFLNIYVTIIQRVQLYQDIDQITRLLL